MRLACLALVAALPAPALAATRSYTVTGFDRISVDGSYSVSVKVGPAVSATAVGDMRAIDRLRVEVQGRTLMIHTDRSAWGGWQGENAGKVVVNVTAPAISGAALGGSGTLAIDRAKAMRFDVALNGSGEVTIANLATDRLAMALVGSGALAVAGRASQLHATLQGSGGIDATKLAVDDLDVAATGSGDASFLAGRSAKVSAAGSGNIVVAGAAACTVSKAGSGDVTCGKRR